MTFPEFTLKLQSVVDMAVKAATALLKIPAAPVVAIPVVDVTDETLIDGDTQHDHTKVKATLRGIRQRNGKGRMGRDGGYLLPIPASWLAHRHEGNAPETLAALVAGILSAVYDSKAASTFRADLMIVKDKDSGTYRFNPPAGFDLPSAWNEVLTELQAFPYAATLALLNIRDVKPPSRFKVCCPGDLERKKPEQHYSGLFAQKFLGFATANPCPICNTPLGIYGPNDLPYEQDGQPVHAAETAAAEAAAA